MPTMRDLRWPLKAAISIGLLGYLVSLVPFVDVMSAIAGAQVHEVALAIVLGMMARYAEASRMRLLTHRRGIPLSTWDIQRINLTTNFYDMLLPGDFAGGVIRWYKLSLAGNNAGGALEALIVNRLTQTMVLAGFGTRVLGARRTSASAWRRRHYHCRISRRVTADPLVDF